MKKPYLMMMLFVLICSACSHKPAVEDSCRIVAKGAKMYDLCIDQKMISKPKDTSLLLSDSNKNAFILVHLWVRNNSNDSLKYESMTCDSDIIFRVNNKYINFIKEDCLYNIPTWVSIPAHQMKKYDLFLTLNKESIATNNEFKIGIKFIKTLAGDDIVFMPFKDEDLIWSNPIKVPLN